MFRNWLWEILSIAAAIGLIVAIAALLATHNGKPTPDWGERINFNALLAIMSTILRAMLVVVVSQIISQRKWEWFAASHERPLIHLQQFDSGSRGSMGALSLLPTVLLKDVVTFMAALILFASFLVGPAVQQASRTVECMVVAPGLKASLPFGHFVPRRAGYGVPQNGSPYGIPDVDLTAAVLSAITSPGSLENQIRGSCSTGNCTFPDGDPVNGDDAGSIFNNFTSHSTVGMCNKCVDVSSLVVRNGSDKGGSCQTLTLPNNLSTLHCGSGSTNVRIRPSLDLAWMGEELTPELRAISRWAHVNATFLTKSRNDSTTAAMCSLYPCVRTYTSFINNSDVFETPLQSSVMQVDLPTGSSYMVDAMTRNDAYMNRLGTFTAVQSPCRVDDKIYDLKNMSMYTNGSKLALYDFTDYGGTQPHRVRSTNITAPESCIYRQHPDFVSAIANLFVEEMFNGSCSSYKGPNCGKTINNADGEDRDRTWQGYAADLGAKTVLLTLYSNGYTSYSNVTKWFDKFADTMTNRYRSDYGTAIFNDSRRVDLPLEENQGLAWQNTTCVSMRSGWLLIPIILTAVTTILAIWTIATNWRQRHSRPVWKDNILPLLFYGREMIDYKLDAHSQQTKDRTSSDDTGARSNAPLLETSEMEKISASTRINIRWLYGAEGTVADDSGETPKSTSQTRRIWRPRKREEHSSNSLLLEPFGGSRPQRGESEDQISPENAEPYEGSQGNIDDTSRGSRPTR